MRSLWTAQALYDAVVAPYSSPATAALGRLLLPHKFLELPAFATVEDLVSHLRTSDARYRAAAPAEFLARNQPPMFITLYFIVTRLLDSLRSVRDHFLSLDPTVLTIDLLEQHLLAAETSVVASLPVPPLFSLVRRFRPAHSQVFTSPWSSLYTLATEPPQVAASAQMSVSGPVAPPCLCRLLSHQTLLWHNRLGRPSLPRLRGMQSRLLVYGLPRSVPSLLPLPAPPCLPCIEGRQRTAPHSSLFPSTTAPLQTLHMDIGGEFSSELLREFCRGEGILQSFTLPDSPQQNGIAERRIGLVMEVAHTSMIHAAAPHFLWSFAVRYAAHQLNFMPHVSFPETSPTLRWTGEVGDASVFRVWGSRAFVDDTSADMLTAHAIPCVFLGFPLDAHGWQFYHPTSRRVFSSQDVTFDESVP
ncbi:unnamed protein product [Closterium sp. NIES-53]